MTLNVDAEASVEFAEDLSYTEVPPLLDAFRGTPVFRVRSSRVAYSGPWGDSVDVALIVTATLAAGGAAFAKVFFGELAQDTYQYVRKAMAALAKRLRRRSSAEVRANYAVMVVVGSLRFVFGTELHHAPGPDEWSDEWLTKRFTAAQAVVDEAPHHLVDTPLGAMLAEIDASGSGEGNSASLGCYKWDDNKGGWVPNHGMKLMLAYGHTAPAGT